MTDPSTPIAEPGAPRASQAPRRTRRIALGTGAIVVLAAGGSGAAVAFTGGSGGASSPAAAVSALLDAANHGDALGALDALVPGERRALAPGLASIVAELQRLDVLSSSADLGDISGLNLHFSGVTTSTAQLTPRLAAVTFTGGKVTSSADVAKLPLGSFVRGLLPASTPASPTSTSTLHAGRAGIVTELVNGTWYVSLGYTIAVDDLRSKGAGDGAPPSGGVTATGASSPAAAVRSFLDAATALDLRAMLGDLPPGEMGALQAYAPLFLPAAEAKLATAQEKLHIALTSLDLSSSSVAGGTLVKVASLGFRLSYGADTITYANGCETVSVNGTTTRTCTGTSSSAAAVRASLLAVLPADIRAIVNRIAHEQEPFGFVTVEENGAWYVSPVGTALEDLSAFLGYFEPGDLTSIAALATNHAELKTIESRLGSLILSTTGATGTSPA